MKKLPALLRSAAIDCRTARKPILIAVLLAGVISITVVTVLFRAVVTASRPHFTALVGAEEAARIEQRILAEPAGDALQREMLQAMAAADPTFAGKTEEQQLEALMHMSARIVSGVLPVIIGFAMLTFIMHLWLYAFFLTAATKKTASFGTLAGDAVAGMLPLLGVGVIAALVAGGWVLVCLLLGFLLSLAVAQIGAFIGLAVLVAGVFLYAPRFALSSAIVVADRPGVVESLRRSFRITKGRYWKVVGNLISASAVVWMFTFIAQFLLGLLLRTLPVTPVIFTLGQTVTFVELAGLAFTTVFLVRLKETLASARG